MIICKWTSKQGEEYQVEEITGKDGLVYWKTTNIKHPNRSYLQRLIIQGFVRRYICNCPSGFWRDCKHAKALKKAFAMAREEKRRQTRKGSSKLKADSRARKR